jgi:hypothetical protein
MYLSTNEAPLKAYILHYTVMKNLKDLRSLIALIGLLFITTLANAQGDATQSCYCKVSVNEEKSPARKGHFLNIQSCSRYLEKKGFIEVWSNVCSEQKVEYTLSCGADEVIKTAKCISRTKHHNFLLLNEKASLPKADSVFTFHDSSRFSIRKSFSYLNHFLERNRGLDLSNSLYGGIYEQGTKNRVDLTILDFYLQVENLFNHKKFTSQLTKLRDITQQDPIKNFTLLYQWLDEEIESNKKVRKRLKHITPLIYNERGAALIPSLSFINKNNVFSPRRDKHIKLYNQIIQSKNRVKIFKKLKQVYFPDLKTPITVELLSTRKKKELKETILKVHWQEHLSRVRGFNTDNSLYQYDFKMNSRGDTILENANIKDPTATPISRSTIDIFNYIHNKLDLEFLKSVFHNIIGGEMSLEGISPLVVSENMVFWEDVVQEDSWARHISAGNDTILLIFRDWLKKNQTEVLEKLAERELDTDLLNELKKWKNKTRPKRGLTLDLYPILEKDFPLRPWEKHYLLNSRGEKFVLGEKKLKRTMRTMRTMRTIRTIRTIIGRFKSIAKVENIASAAVASGVMAVSANAYASAAASTLIHDFITAKRYGHEVDKYMIQNTPANMLSALIFSTGFTPGRMADAVFRGAANGALQSVITGSSVKLGMIVGGLSGGALHQLPPELSNWIIPGEDKNTLNIFSEIAEQAFFKGINGAVVSYYEDGDWQKGLKKGAAYGAGSAAVKIAIFGVRYDANSYISDEEIAEYNELHNHADGHYCGVHLNRDTSVMTDRYGMEININRDDIQRAQFRRDGLLMKGKSDSVLGTNFSSPFGSEIGMAEGYLTREETLLHEVMHTRQMQQGRMLNIINRLGPNSVPEGFWEEYRNVGSATLPKGYYKTFIYVNLEGDLAS